jgi:FkbM family methyltransferase
LKGFLRKIFRIISLAFVGTGISKNKIIFSLVENIKKWLKEDYVFVDGCKLKLDETDRHGFTIYGEEDIEERELIKKIIKEGNTVVDVGANIGYHTIIMAKYVGTKGQVYAFEPAPNNVKLLKKTMKLNNFENVQIIDKAVSDKPDKTFFYFSKGISAHSLVDFGYKNGGVNVDVVSLDDFFNNEIKVDFIKIDAEGFDFKVMKGMKNILKNTNLKILIEFFPDRLKKAGDSPKEFLLNLFENGFSVKDLKKDKKLTLNDVNEIVNFYDSDPPNHMTNFYCEKEKSN